MYLIKYTIKVGCKGTAIFRPVVELACADLPEHVAVHGLKDFVEAKLAEALHRVADERGSPALSQAPGPIFLQCD